MGILTRRQGATFVITSDISAETVSPKHAPRRVGDVYRVWTGAGWSSTLTDAMSFDSLDEADEYVRQNYAKVLV